MRVCTNCGTQFRDDELICPVCGHEVQLVPDFVTIESSVQEQRFQDAERAKLLREQQQRAAAIERRKKQIRNKLILAVCAAAAAVIAILVGVFSSARARRMGSYEYQYAAAQEAFAAQDWDRAATAVEQALAARQDDRDALFLKAEILAAENDAAGALAVLESLTAARADDADAFSLALQLYEQQGKPDAMRSLLKKCKNDAILKKYAAYLAEAPNIAPSGGSYTKSVTVSMSAQAAGSIYYTLDGSAPTEASERYTGPFDLSEGQTTVSAALLTDAGVWTDVKSESFDLKLEAPATPVIEPPSGTYTHVQETDSEALEKIADAIDASDASGKDYADIPGTYEYAKKERASDTARISDVSYITIKVPEGYTCYFAFDRQPTKQSSVYRHPVAMREGDHVFYAVFASSDGRLGRAASATYVYTVTQAEPTATSAPQESFGAQEPDSAYQPTQTYDPEEVTPTEEPTKAPEEGGEGSDGEKTSSDSTETGAEGSDSESDEEAPVADTDAASTS